MKAPGFILLERQFNEPGFQAECRDSSHWKPLRFHKTILPHPSFGEGGGIVLETVTLRLAGTNLWFLHTARGIKLFDFFGLTRKIDVLDVSYRPLCPQGDNLLTSKIQVMPAVVH